MIDLHLSAFAPRWRFLYAVRIDAYQTNLRITLDGTDVRNYHSRYPGNRKAPEGIVSTITLRDS